MWYVMNNNQCTPICGLFMISMVIDIIEYLNSHILYMYAHAVFCALFLWQILHIAEIRATQNLTSRWCVHFFFLCFFFRKYIFPFCSSRNWKTSFVERRKFFNNCATDKVDARNFVYFQRKNCVCFILYFANVSNVGLCKAGARPVNKSGCYETEPKSLDCARRQNVGRSACLCPTMIVTVRTAPLAWTKRSKWKSTLTKYFVLQILKPVHMGLSFIQLNRVLFFFLLANCPCLRFTFSSKCVSIHFYSQLNGIAFQMRHKVASLDV